MHINVLKKLAPAAFVINSASVLDFVSQEVLKMETGIISLTQEMAVGADVTAKKIRQDVPGDL